MGCALTLNSAVFSQLWFSEPCLVSDDKFQPSEKIPPPPLARQHLKRECFSKHRLLGEWGGTPPPAPIFYPQRAEKGSGRKATLCGCCCSGALGRNIWDAEGCLDVFTNCRLLNFWKINSKGTRRPFVPAGISSPPLALLMGFPCYENTSRRQADNCPIFQPI